MLYHQWKKKTKLKASEEKEQKNATEQQHESWSHTMHESHQGRIAAETTPEDKGRTAGAVATTSRAATAKIDPTGMD